MKAQWARLRCQSCPRRIAGRAAAQQAGQDAGQGPTVLGFWTPLGESTTDWVMVTRLSTVTPEAGGSGHSSRPAGCQPSSLCGHRGRRAARGRGAVAVVVVAWATQVLLTQPVALVHRVW